MAETLLKYQDEDTSRAGPKVFSLRYEDPGGAVSQSRLPAPSASQDSHPESHPQRVEAGLAGGGQRAGQTEPRTSCFTPAETRRGQEHRLPT